MRINLRSRELGMSQQFFQTFNTNMMIQHCRSKRMPQDMRAFLFQRADPREVFLHNNTNIRRTYTCSLSRKGTRISTSNVRIIVKENLSRVCSLKKKSPHVLRHTFATAMLNHHVGIESLKKLLGHAKLSTTEIYTHTTFEQLKRVYNEAHPRA